MNYDYNTLIGKQVEVMWMNGSLLIYAGVLAEMKDTCLVLKDPALVWETGPHTDKKYKEAQRFGTDLYVRLDGVSSIRECNKTY